MRILAIVPGGISDQLLFFPALEDIKRVYPNAEIGVVAEPKAAPAYRVSKIVDTVTPFSFSAANSPSDWANLLGNVRDREYEVVLTTDLSWSMGLLLWLSGVPTRVTFKGTSAPYFYTSVLPDGSLASQYQADRYHSLLSAIGIEGATPALSVNVPEGDLGWAKEMRDRLDLKGGYVLMYPGPDTGSAEIGARFPVPSWQAVIKDFRAKQPQMPIVLLQTEGSIPQINALRVGDDKLIVANAENLGQAAAVIAGADLLVTPDSYVMQLSTALQVFTLALFGKNKPEEMLPSVKGEEPRFLGIASKTNQIADIPPAAVLEKVWGG